MSLVGASRGRLYQCTASSTQQEWPDLAPTLARSVDSFKIRKG